MIQDVIDQLHVQMTQNKFKSGHIALIDANTEINISHSVREFLNRRLFPDRALEKIIAEQDKKAVKILTERGVEYVISKPLMIASNFSALKKTGDFKADSYLAVFVTQKDILSSVRRIVGFAVAVAVTCGSAIACVVCVTSRVHG